MFEGLKRLFGGKVEQPVAGQAEQSATHTFEQPAYARPWEDGRLSPEERIEAYKALVCEKLEEIRIAFDRAREVHDIATQKKIMNSPETKEWMGEGVWLESASAQEFCQRFNYQAVRQLLRRNFLGKEAWQSQGIDVGIVPPIPATVTEALLDSECPLHRRKKIQDTHLLVLVPKTVNGEPYSALKLDELCATRKGSGDALIYDEFNSWKSLSWASAPQAKSEWVLLPRDPNSKTAPEAKRFRLKTIAAQQMVLESHYAEYREVQTVELMTAVLLNDLVNGGPRMLDGWTFVRCAEPTAFDGRVCVGNFQTEGLRVFDDDGKYTNYHLGLGLALARKL